MRDAALVHVLTRRFSEAAGAYRTVFRNPSLRRVQLVYGTSIAAEWGAVVALAVFAYELRGAVGVGIVGIVRMAPAAVATPFVALLSDRFPRERVLTWIELCSAAALAASTAAFYAGQAEIPIYAFAGLLAIFSTLLRPTLAALLPTSRRRRGADRRQRRFIDDGEPGHARRADPRGGGGGGCGCRRRLRRGGRRLPDRCGSRPGSSESRGLRLSSRSAGRPRSCSAGSRRLQEPQPRLLIALFAAQTLVRGALNVLIVVLAFRLLHAGGSWVGFLTAAIGAGGLIGAFASVSLTGRRLAVRWSRPASLGASHRRARSVAEQGVGTRSPRDRGHRQLAGGRGRLHAAPAHRSQRGPRTSPRGALGPRDGRSGRRLGGRAPANPRRRYAGSRRRHRAVSGGARGHRLAEARLDRPGGRDSGCGAGRDRKGPDVPRPVRGREGAGGRELDRSLVSGRRGDREGG